MDTSSGGDEPMATSSVTELDVAIIGAGFAGLYSIYHFPRLGLTARVYEKGENVGGTWYWNRYPGARVDIESMEYSFAFSDEVQQEWEWSERYASQSELQDYANFVADRLDLRKDIQFNTRIVSLVYDENVDRWLLETDGGERISAKYCVMATGMLSTPNKPEYDGMGAFEGNIYHSFEWPEEPVDFTGQRVCVIGTGSSAIQMIPLIAEQAEHLHVLQRTPGYAVPLRNHAMPPEYQAKVKADYKQWRYKERYESFGGWVSVNYEPVDLMTQSAMEVDAAERLALYEDRWKSGGLAFYNIYPDVYWDKAANDTLSDFLRGKIRERVKDPAIAEKLMPTFPALTKRLMADTNYYETYNRDNVTLVDIKDTPIEEFTAKGIRIAGVEHEFDSIVFATGFDALTGTLIRLDIKGRGGATMQEHWDGGARTHLGLMCADFPNMFILSAAGSPAVLFQPILLCEEQVNWVGNCIQFLARYGFSSIAPTSESEDYWGKLCTEAVERTLFPLTNSWYLGKNIPGKSSTGMIYFGGMGNYRKHLADAEAGGYSDFMLTVPPKATSN